MNGTFSTAWRCALGMALVTGMVTLNSGCGLLRSAAVPFKATARAARDTAQTLSLPIKSAVAPVGASINSVVDPVRKSAANTVQGAGDRLGLAHHDDQVVAASGTNSVTNTSNGSTTTATGRPGRNGLSNRLHQRFAVVEAKHAGKHRAGPGGVSAVIEPPSVRVEGYVFKPGPVTIPAAGLTLADALRQAGGPYVARSGLDELVDGAVPALRNGIVAIIDNSRRALLSRLEIQERAGVITLTDGTTQERLRIDGLDLEGNQIVLRTEKGVFTCDGTVTGSGAVRLKRADGKVFTVVDSNPAIENPLNDPNHRFTLHASDLLVSIRRDGPFGESVTYFALPLVQLYAAGQIRLRPSDFVRVVDWRSTTLGDGDSRQAELLNAFLLFETSPSTVFKGRPDDLQRVLRKYTILGPSGATAATTTWVEDDAKVEDSVNRINKVVFSQGVQGTEDLLTLTRLNSDTNERETFVLPLFNFGETVGSPNPPDKKKINEAHGLFVKNFPNFNEKIITDRMIFEGDILGQFSTDQIPLVVADSMTRAATAGAQNLTAAELRSLASSGVLNRVAPGAGQLQPGDLGLPEIQGLTMPKLAIPILR